MAALPNFIGIGAPKAGTTWLARCLAEHPEVFVAAAKEVCFLDYATIDGRIAEYQAHFVGSNGAKAIGEFTTRYLASERPPVRIRALLPGARLIVSLRNPIDQVYSHYWHLSRQNFHSWDITPSRLTFEQALETHESQLTKDAFYYSHLTRWLNHFDRDQILILLYDDVCDRPADVLRTVYMFLDVDPKFVPASVNARGSKVREGVSPRGGVFQKIHTRIYTSLNRRIYDPLKRGIGVARANRIKEVLHVRQIMENVFFRRGYPPMNTRTRARLLERFADDIRGVSELLGRDLSHWK